VIYAASISGVPSSASATARCGGRIATLAETVDRRHDTYVYTYDSAHAARRRAEERHRHRTYTYDANGNRLGFAGTGGPAQPARTTRRIG
jgi:hypothetical protein